MSPPIMPSVPQIPQVTNCCFSQSTFKSSTATCPCSQQFPQFPKKVCFWSYTEMTNSGYSEQLECLLLSPIGGLKFLQGLVWKQDDCIFPYSYSDSSAVIAWFQLVTQFVENSLKGISEFFNVEIFRGENSFSPYHLRYPIFVDYYEWKSNQFNRLTF